MVFEFRLPDLGEGIAEGELIKWLIKEGDFVKEHQAIAEIETDKAVVQVPSPKLGKILKLNVAPGNKIQVGEILCVIGKCQFCGSQQGKVLNSITGRCRVPRE